MAQVTKIELLNVLALLFQKEEEAKFVVSFTSLDVQSIDFNDSPKGMWRSILIEALKYESGISEILENAIDEFKDKDIKGKQVLLDALEYGIVGDRKKEKIKEENIPFKNILKSINKDNFGEIRRVDCNRDFQVQQYYVAKKKSCVISYIFGDNENKPNSFVERMMLETLEDSENVDSGEQNCWLYRMKNGDQRVTQIPFKTRSEIEACKKQLSSSLELLLEGLDMDNAKKYFAHQNYKHFSFSIIFKYALGSMILKPFTEWIINSFAEIEETNFQIFIILTGIESEEDTKSHLDEIVNSADLVDSVSIIPIQIENPVNESHIKDWKTQINLGYVYEDFLEDLKFLEIPEQEIAEYISTKELSMLTMEKFQNNLYDAFYKNS